MRWFAVAVVVVIGAILFLGYMQSRSLWCAGIAYSRLALTRALSDLREHGSLQKRDNPTEPFSYTNSIIIDGSNFTCVAGYEDSKFYGKGFLAVTTNEVFIFVHKNESPFLVPKLGCP